MFKKISFIAASALVLAAVSCTKTEGPAVTPGRVIVSVRISTDGSVTTRAAVPAALLTATEAEKAVNDAVIIVYSKDGSGYTFRDCKSWGEASNNGAVTFMLPNGHYEFFAAVNTGETDSGAKFATYTALNGYETILNPKESSGNFTMFGSQDVSDIASNNNVTVAVKRSVAKFVLGKVKYAPNYLGAPADITLKKVFVINAAGNTTAGATIAGTKETAAEITQWFNKRTILQNPYNALLVSEDCSDEIAKDKEKDYTHLCSLYSYPNYTDADSHAALWSARKTRVVIEAEFEGDLCYYPVTLTNVERNKLYYITNVVITGKGLDNPDDQWTGTKSVSGTIQILPWDDGGTIEPTF